MVNQSNPESLPIPKEEVENVIIVVDGNELLSMELEKGILEMNDSTKTFTINLTSKNSEENESISNNSNNSNI